MQEDKRSYREFFEKEFSNDKIFEKIVFLIVALKQLASA